jgi:hypothetical protein
MLFSLVMFKIGVIAGFVMVFVAATLHQIKFTTLDLIKYFGGLLTGKIAGSANFISGLLLHLCASGVWANLYYSIIIYKKVAICTRHALYFGLAHALIAGMLLPLFDHLNPCVAHKTLKPLGFYTINYGMSSVVTYVLGHVMYAMLVFKMQLPIF